MLVQPLQALLQLPALVCVSPSIRAAAAEDAEGLRRIARRSTVVNALSGPRRLHTWPMESTLDRQIRMSGSQTRAARSMNFWHDHVRGKVIGATARGLSVQRMPSARWKAVGMPPA